MTRLCPQCGRQLHFFKRIVGQLFCSVEHRRLYVEKKFRQAIDRVMESSLSRKREEYWLPDRGDAEEILASRQP